jgi:hypothetical protein
VDHQFDTLRLGEIDDPGQVRRIVRGAEAEEGVGGNMPLDQPGIDQAAVESVERALLAFNKSETPPNRRPDRQNPPKDHVETQMKVLMPVEMGRVSPKETPVFLELIMKGRVDSSGDEGVIDDLGPGTPSKEANG